MVFIEPMLLRSLIVYSYSWLGTVSITCDDARSWNNGSYSVLSVVLAWNTSLGFFAGFF